MKYEATVEARTVGELIKAARKRRGLTQTQLAAMLGTTHQSVERWENSKTDGVKACTMRKICAVLGVTPNYLFGLEGMNGNETPLETAMRVKLDKIRRLTL